MPDRARATKVAFPHEDEEAAGPVGSYIDERSSPFQHVRSVYARDSVTGMASGPTSGGGGQSSSTAPKRRSLLDSAGAMLDLLNVRRTSTAASAPGGLGGRPLLTEEAGTELAAPQGGMEREVEVLVETKEWGEGVSSSSDSEDWHFNRRQSLQKKPNPAPKASGSGEKGELEVQQQDHEWGAGMGLSDSSDSDSEESDPRANRRNRARVQAPDSDSDNDANSSDDEGQNKAKKTKKKTRFQDESDSDKSSENGDDEDDDEDIEAARAEQRRGAGAVRQRGSSASGKRGRSFRNQVAICSTSKTMGFVFFTMIYLLDNSLRVICMVIHYKSFAVQITFYIQAALMVIGATLSTYIVFHDTDVLLWMHHQRRQWQKLAVALMSFLVLGCLQLIQVKRAWSRQLSAAQALSDLEDDKKKGGAGADDAMPGISSAERIMPAALATGVPFLLVNHLWNSLCNVDKKITWAPEMITASNFVTSIAVSLAVSDLDFEVSNHVWKRYHLRNRTKMKGLKMLFPLLHRTFRFVEVYWRMQVLSGMVLIAKLIMKKVWDAQYADLSVIWMLPVVDFAIAVALLRMHSPGKDKAATHCAAGVAIVLSDLAHFVDRPNFAAPARAFSRALLVVRSLEWVVVCGSLYGLITYGDVLDPHCIGTQQNEDLWPLLISGLIYYPLRMFFPISRLGHDLHTAAAGGDIRRLKLLLNADANGSVLDLNARSKDPLAQTALMRAALNGHADCAQLLLTNGAGVDEKTERDETALHLAASHCHVEVMKVLLRYKADVDLTDREGETPLDKALACKKRPRPDPPTDADLKDLLTSSSGGITSLASRRKTCQVPAQKATGLELKNLFPEVQEEDTPSPRVLQSVSALVVSRAAGTLSRRLLSREDERQTGTVALGALRRIRELGKGGFGKVIEVEVPSSASSTLFGQESTTRYALKLQLKQHQGQAHSEVLALQRAAHPFIVHLERAFTLDKYFALLLELCPTDLNKVLCEQDADGRSLGLEPYRAARYMGQILLALSFLHTELKTVFRDLKPENILISLKDEAKLTDFGLAKVVTSAQRMTMCGTAGFWPPEMTATGAAHSIRASTLLSLADSSAEGALVVSEKSFGKKEAERRPFKFDSYSFGVTLQLALLGEDAGRRREIHKKGPMMLPLHITEEENDEMLQNLKDSGRLGPEAYDLLVENTLCYEVTKRKCLFDPEIMQHPFFLNTLNCKDLHEGLVGSKNKDSSPLRRMMGRFVGKGSSTDKLSAASSASLDNSTPGNSM